jgi:hypothetical protein
MRETKSPGNSERKEECKRIEEAMALVRRGHLGQAVWILTSLMPSPQRRYTGSHKAVLRALAYAYAVGGLDEKRARLAMAVNADQQPGGAKTRHQRSVQLPRASLVAGIPVAINTLTGNNR